MFLLVVLVAAGVGAAPPPASERDPQCGYRNCERAEPGVLNVHIVAHTHDDVGWLKTVDQYYYGGKNTIQKAGVQYILDSVIKELWEDPKRKFIYVETAFFWKWWVRQSETVQARVRVLVRDERLQFVGGAWSMNDEAAAHYQSVVDQFTWGLSKLNETFGPCALPRAGWQIDPFGHSRQFAAALAAMGYDGLFLGRIDYQDKAARLRDRRMEMLWRGDDDLGAASDMFTSVLYNTYSPPAGFCFDVLCDDSPVVDDVGSPEYNVDDKVDRFINICKNMSEAYSTNNVLVTMGEDFNYQDALMWFTNLDKLITVSHDGGVVQDREHPGDDGRRLSVHGRGHVVHQLRQTHTVASFVEHAVRQARHYRSNNVLLTMGGDFTYQDAHMWYINLDKLILYTNLKAAKDGLNIKLFYSTPNCYLKAVKEANPTLPIKQDDFFPYASDPHAYWTGYFTSRPTTKYFERQGNDYLQMAKQLQVLAGLEAHNQFMLNSLKSAMGVMQHHDAITGTEKQHVTHDYERLLDDAIDDSLVVPRQAFTKMMQGGGTEPPLFSFDRCRLNESSCCTSETSDQFVVTLYSPVSWAVKEPVRVPVCGDLYEVITPDGEKIDSQMVDIPRQVMDIPTRRSKATREVVFIAHLKPLMYKSFYVRKVPLTDGNIAQADENVVKIGENIAQTNKVKPDVEISKTEKNATETERIISKRDVTVFKPHKRLGDTYVHVNDYWNHAREPDADLELVPEPPPARQRPTVDDIDLDLLRDRDVPLEHIQQLERIIEQEREKVDFRERRRESVRMYSGLNEDEMRMLSDEPQPTRVVEVFEDYFVIENEVASVVGETVVPLGRGNVSLSFGYYPACVGNNEEPRNRSSGAYIFRPNATEPVPLEPAPPRVVKGAVVSELRTAYSDNVLSVVRRYAGLAYVEVEWLVGAVDVSDQVGKEFIVRYDTGLATNGEFYTDSNGRQPLKRRAGERPQWNVTLAERVGGNYYPVVSRAAVGGTGERLTVLTDRAQGGSSLQEGQLELMLHRRLLHDDAFGVGEALNETAGGEGLAVRGTHRLLLAPEDDSEESKQAIQMHLRPLVFVSSAAHVDLGEWLQLHNCFSFLNKLPEGIHLLTLEPWEGRMLLRLENYLKSSEHSTVEVEIADILNHIRVKSVTETMLAANDLTDKWKWNTEEHFSESFNDDYGGFGGFKRARNVERGTLDGSKVIIKAKEIRTFLVDYEFVG